MEMEHSLIVKQTPTGREGCLSCGGDMTMVQAQEFHQALLQAILAVDTLNIDLQGVGLVDISFLQLLCSAHRECGSSGKNIHLQGQCGDFLGPFMEKAGYRKRSGCSIEAKASCLWKALT